MTDFSSLQTKVNDLKAKIEHNSISPSYLGSILDEILVHIKSADNSTRISELDSTLRALLTSESQSRQTADNALETLINDLTPAMVIPDLWGMLWRSGDSYEDAALQIDTAAGKVRLMSKVLWYATEKGRHDWAIAGNIDTLFETDWVLPAGDTLPNKGQAHFIVMDWTEKKAYGVQFQQLEQFVAARKGHRLVLLAAGPLGYGYGKSFTTFGPIVLDGILYSPTGSEPMSLREAGVVKGDSLAVSMEADKGTISYTSVTSDATQSAHTATIPQASTDKAGLMTPQHLSAIADLIPAMVIPDFWGMLWRSGDSYKDAALQIDTAAGKVRLMSKVLWGASQKVRFDWALVGNIDTLFETDWVLPAGDTLPNKGQWHYIVMDWTEKKAYGVQFTQLEQFVAARKGHKLVLLAAGTLGNGYGKSFTTFGPIVLDGILYSPTGSEPMSLREAGVVKGDSLTVSMEADKGTISYTSVTSDATQSEHTATIPQASTDKAGLMSPQQVSAITALKAHRLAGHRLVILGDSLSAYRGWIPDGNSTWYDGRGDGVNWQDNDVSSVTDMWWHKLCRRLGCTLLLNESYSGSTIANMRGTANVTPSSFVTRCARSIGAGATLSPKGDIIIIQGGLNDTWGGTAHGTPNYTGTFTAGELNDILPAFCNILHNITLYNPGAKVLFLIDDAVDDTLKDSMRGVCDHMGITYVDIINAPKINGHYSKAGHDFVCDQVAAAITAMYN